MNNEFEHSPGASLDYGFDYSKWLATGETIVDSVWADVGGLTLSNGQIEGGKTSVFATGGVANTIYYLANTITTSTVPPRITTLTLVLSCKRH